MGAAIAWGGKGGTAVPPHGGVRGERQFPPMGG